MHRTHQLIAAIALSTLAAAASAKVIASGNSPSNFVYTASGTLLPLTTTSSTGVLFNASKAGTYVLTFSAECAVDAPVGNTGAWVDLDIVVNGTVVPATAGTSDAFCTANGTWGSDGWVRASITTAVTLVAGSNSLRVLGKFSVGAVGGWIGNSAFVIHQ